MECIAPFKSCFFEEHILQTPADCIPIKEWGFKDMRIGALSDEEAQQAVWDYWGNHGCFIGGAPVTAGYTHHGLTDPAHTPFARLYYVWRGPLLWPLVALRLRAETLAAGPLGDESRVYDAMEQLDWGTKEGELAIYQLIDEAFPPDCYMGIPEDAFLAHFGAVATRWV